MITSSTVDLIKEEDGVAHRGLETCKMTPRIIIAWTVLADLIPIQHLPVANDGTVEESIGCCVLKKFERIFFDSHWPEYDVVELSISCSMALSGRASRGSTDSNIPDHKR